MIQILLHLWGDYLTQSDWMAQNKTKASLPALVHALVYSLPFLLLRPSWIALCTILCTHFCIDRWRLARYVVWAKNWLAPTWFLRSTDTDKWSNCTRTGYAPNAPDWLAFWLLIIADNTLHLTINYCALRWL